MTRFSRDLYIVGAGVRPSTTVPICLDLGTNTQKFIDDPLYLGLRRKRPDTEEVIKHCFKKFPKSNRSVDGRLYARVH